MKIFLKPWWIFLFILLPISVLILLYSNTFTLLQSQLNSESVKVWFGLGIYLASMALGATIYSLICILKQREINPKVGLFLLFGYVTFLYIFFVNIDTIIPSGIPSWLSNQENLVLYLFTFLMPGLSFGLILAVLWLTPDNKECKTPINIVLLISIPIFWFIIYHISDSFNFIGNNEILIHTSVIFFIITTVLFFFFLVRIQHLTFVDRAALGQKASIVTTIIFSLCLPVLAYIVYNSKGFLPGNIIGNFKHPVIVILTVLNGTMLTFSFTQNKSTRFILFIGKSFCYSFVFYFFIVLLPLLPLSIIAIIVVGFGFLMLSPIILMVLSSHSLIQDFKFLSNFMSNKVLIVIFTISFLIIPSYFLITFTVDKITINNALAFLYEADLSKAEGKINITSLKRTLQNIRLNSGARGFNQYKQLPYISPFYSWYVFNNLSLADDKILLLEKLFFPSHKHAEVNPMFRAVNDVPHSNTKIENAYFETKLSEDKTFYRTWVRLEIKNYSYRQSEFATYFRLPEGAWISNYYLDIENRREYGILAEKKSAKWVYKEIRDARRDPGILFYTKNNNICLRVFPFESRRTRLTGFEITHIEPLQFRLDDNVTIDINNIEVLHNKETSLLNNTVTAIPQTVKQNLNKITRKPFYHFIIDCSEMANENGDEFNRRIDQFLHKNDILKDSVKYTLANYNFLTLPYDNNLTNRLNRFNKTGGFFLERAFKKELLQNFIDNKPVYPIFIVVTDNFEYSIFPEGMNDFSIAYPESDMFYVLNSDDMLTSHSFNAPHSEGIRVNTLNPPQVQTLAWPDNNNTKAYLPDDNQLSIVMDLNNYKIGSSELKDQHWNNGVILQSMVRYNCLFPDNGNKHWHSIIENSFNTRFLTKYTSYISLENDAQKEALYRKQSKVLNSKKSLDIKGENKVPEPSVFIICLLLLSTLYINHKRKKALTSKI